MPTRQACFPTRIGDQIVWLRIRFHDDGPTGEWSNILRVNIGA